MKNIEETYELTRNVKVSYSNKECSVELVFVFTGEGKSRKEISNLSLERIEYYYSDYHYCREYHWNPEDTIEGVLDQIQMYMNVSEVDYVNEYKKRRFNFDIVKNNIIYTIFKNKELNKYFEDQGISKEQFLNLTRDTSSYDGEWEYKTEPYTWEQDIKEYLISELHLDGKSYDETMLNTYAIKLKDKISMITV